MMERELAFPSDSRGWKRLLDYGLIECHYSRIHCAGVPSKQGPVYSISGREQQHTNRRHHNVRGRADISH